MAIRLLTLSQSGRLAPNPRHSSLSRKQVSQGPSSPIRFSSHFYNPGINNEIKDGRYATNLSADTTSIAARLGADSTFGLSDAISFLGAKLRLLWRHGCSDTEEKNRKTATDWWGYYF